MGWWPPPQREPVLKFGQIHPIMLLHIKKCHITLLLVRRCNERASHQGHGLTINEIRASGFWVVGCSHAVSSLIHSCITCRKYQARTEDQHMTHLPKDRLTTEPLFSPFCIRQGRKKLKRHGVIFTCLSSRAIRLEVADSLTANGFLLAWRRLVAIRGPVTQVCSDRGTNFEGAQRELAEAIKEMDTKSIQTQLAEQHCDFLSFKMNPPAASHMPHSHLPT